MAWNFTNRRRLARKVRHTLSIYLITLQPHIRNRYPDWEERAWGALLSARADLNTLIELDNTSWDKSFAEVER